jgi:hypothetical protein
MYSRKAIPIGIILLLALIVSYADAANQDSPAAYRLIVSDNEDVATPAPQKAEPLPREKIYADEGYQSEGYPQQGCYGQGCGVAGCYGEGCYQSSCGPRWTATADAMIMDRIGTKSRTLVQGVTPIFDGETSLDDEVTELLNSNDFKQGFFSGPRVSLIRHGDNCTDVELLYFQIDGWNSTRRVTPDRESEQFLVFEVPGIEIFSFSDPMQFKYASKLYNAELNLRWNPTCRVTVLAGFRWVELRERLEGGFISPTFETFSTFNTKNNLYGFQIGSDAILWQRCRFSIDGLVKAGIFGNHAEQTSTLRDREYTGTVADTTSHTSFLGEVGLQCKYRVTEYLTLRAGYEAMWLGGVALAPGQIDETDFVGGVSGIDTKGELFFHGATAGLECCF